MSRKHTSLGLWTLTALVVGNMIGSGVFLLPAALAKLGTITIYSWIITAIGSLFLALVFSKLSTVFPKTGGPYIYCKETFGDYIGFQVAYNYWIYMWVGNAAIAVAFTGYLSSFFPILATNSFYGFLATASIVWFFTLINIIGVHFAGVIQLILTILKFFPLIILSVIGIFFIDSKNLTFFNISDVSNFSAFSSGAVLTLWAFLGMESASIPADEVKDPKKTIPRATIIGTLLTMLIYILSTVAIMGVIPVTELKDSTAPFADFAAHLFGPWGKAIIALVAIISCAGALNGWILLQGQIPLAAAKDQLFPSFFAKLSKRRTPAFGIAFSSLLITVILFFNFHKSLVNQFTFIIQLAVLAALIAYLYTTIAEFLLPAKKRKTISLIISSIAFVYVFWAIISSGCDTVFYGAMLLFSSVPIYGLMQWKKPINI